MRDRFTAHSNIQMCIKSHVSKFKIMYLKCILVFYSFVTNCFKFTSLKVTPLFSQFPWASIQEEFSRFLSGLRTSHRIESQGCRSHLKHTVLFQAHVDVGRMYFLAVVGLRPSAPELISFYRQFTKWSLAFFKRTRRMILMLHLLLMTSPD